MTITAKVIADSLSPAGKRLTTLQLRYPRFIHSEFMTHRDFSRNASSSRAVPVNRLIQDVIDDTAMPIHWGKNQPGMQAREEHDAEVVIGFGSDDFVFGTAKDAWLLARDNAIQVAEQFNVAGYHKQIVNRLLEPFSHINVVVTATEWENFFNLRIHPDAQPEINALAVAMSTAMEESEPNVTTIHLPYITQEEMQDPANTTYALQLISAARCARVSYMTHEGKKPERVADLQLADRLSAQKHMSPFEHSARSSAEGHKRTANFVGWWSLRSYLEEHEVVDVARTHE